MKKLVLLFTLIFSFSLIASDPWNTYQWNRRNELRGNNRTDRSPWYEWWYYKVVIPETGKSYFFVYGIVNPWDAERTLKGTRSYVGMGDFKKKLMGEEKFELSDFNASYKETFVEVKGNVATDRFFHGSIRDEKGGEYAWDINIEKEWSYNAEGWMMGTNLTDIEWYPAQASAKCSGTVTSGGETVTFTDAPCYQDRNWGSRFPDWWSWIVSNHFEGSSDTVLACGGGKPGVRGNDTPIASMSVGIRHGGKEIAFRPNHMQLVKTNIKFGKWQITAINRTHRVEIEATAPKEDFMDLQFMTPEGVLFHDYETLTGKIKVKLFERKGLFFKPLPELVTNFGGIEYGSKNEHAE